VRPVPPLSPRRISPLAVLVSRSLPLWHPRWSTPCYTRRCSVVSLWPALPTQASRLSSYSDSSPSGLSTAGCRLKPAAKRLLASPLLHPLHPPLSPDKIRGCSTSATVLKTTKSALNLSKPIKQVCNVFSTCYYLMEVAIDVRTRMNSGSRADISCVVLVEQECNGCRRLHSSDIGILAK